MKNVFDLLARLRFMLIALKHCVIKKSKYDSQYYRKLDLEDVNIKTQMVDVMKEYERLELERNLPILYKVSFVPFNVKIASRFCDLFRSLGSPHYADIKTYHNEGIVSAHYKLQVGSIKCRLSLYFYEYKLVLIKAKLTTDGTSSSKEPDILSLLFGHRLPQSVLNNCDQGAFVESTNNTILRIEKGMYDCQVIAFDPYNLGVKRLARPKENALEKIKSNCQVQNWYRKKFGTNARFET